MKLNKKQKELLKEIIEIIKICNRDALNEREKAHGEAILYVIKQAYD